MIFNEINERQNIKIIRADGSVLEYKNCIVDYEAPTYVPMSCDRFDYNKFKIIESNGGVSNILLQINDVMFIESLDKDGVDYKITCEVGKIAIEEIKAVVNNTKINTKTKVVFNNGRVFEFVNCDITRGRNNSLFNEDTIIIKSKNANMTCRIQDIRYIHSETI